MIANPRRLQIGIFVSILYVLLIFSNLLMTISGLVWLRVLIASFVFLLPGGLLTYLIIGGRQWSWVRFVAYGLSASFVINGILSLVARTMNLDMGWIVIVHSLLTIPLLILTIRRVQMPQWKPQKRLMTYLPAIGMGVVVMILVGVFVYGAIQSLLTGYGFNPDAYFDEDIFTYHAEVTYFADESPLDWLDIYLDTGNPIPPRFYLAANISSQALIVFISGVHILLAQFWLVALLVFVSACSFYVSARSFDYSAPISLFITILWLVVMAAVTAGKREVGTQYVARLLQDKQLAAFVLIPVVLGHINVVLRDPTRRNLVLFSILLSSLLFVHPMMLGFALLIIGIWMVIDFVIRRQVKTVFWVLLICFTTALPIFLLRDATGDTYNFDQIIPPKTDLRVWVSDSGDEYALSPYAVGDRLYQLITITTIVALLTLFRHQMGRLLISVMIMVAVGMFPPTAPIYGKLVGIPYIYRVLWFIPFGLALFYSMEQVYRLVQWILRRFSIELPSIIIQAVMAVMVVLSPIYVWQTVLDNRHFDTSVDVASAMTVPEQLLTIADYIENQHPDERVLVLGDGFMRNVVTSMSRHMMTLTHFHALRMSRFSGIHMDEANYRREDNLQFFTPILNNDQRFDVLVEYDVDYILYARQNSDQWMDQMLNQFPDTLKLVVDTPNYRLVQFLNDDVTEA